LQRTWANPSSAALDVAWLLGVNGRGALQLPLNGTGPNGPWLHIVKGSR
jgi:hypothetical protein